jgi:hypothetical protein
MQIEGIISGYSNEMDELLLVCGAKVYVSVTVYFRAGFFNFRTFSASK